MTRRILSVRQLARVLADPAGLRFIVTRAIPGDGVVLEPGQDVTERARGWAPGVLASHVKRGYIATVREPPAVADRPRAFDALCAVGAGSKKHAIRAALAAVGVALPPNASKDELLLLRAAAISAAGAA